LGVEAYFFNKRERAIDTSSIKIFKDKNLDDLLEDVYDNSVQTSERIDKLIDQLADLIEKPEHANIIVPLIKEYLEVDISNDKQLIEIAKIVQRLESAYVRSPDEGGGSGPQLSDNEKNQIRQKIDAFKEEKEEDLKELKKKKEDVVDDVGENKS